MRARSAGGRAGGRGVTAAADSNRAVERVRRSVSTELLPGTRAALLPARPPGRPSCDRPSPGAATVRNAAAESFPRMRARAGLVGIVAAANHRQAELAAAEQSSPGSVLESMLPGPYCNRIATVGGEAGGETHQRGRWAWTAGACLGCLPSAFSPPALAPSSRPSTHAFRRWGELSSASACAAAAAPARLGVPRLQRVCAPSAPRGRPSDHWAQGRRGAGPRHPPTKNAGAVASVTVY